MAMAAVWLQDSDMAAVAHSDHSIMIFTGLVALAMVVQAGCVLVLMIRSHKAIQSMLATVDEMKAKLIPLISSSSRAVESAQAMMRETTPKIRTITDNLVETSEVVRGTAQKLEKTVTDANLRTQRQVARIDGMVTAALVTTAEVVDTISQGIRGPAQKIALMATQAKVILEGVLTKVKVRAGSV
jgi:hypothetical protein